MWTCGAPGTARPTSASLRRQLRRISREPFCHLAVLHYCMAGWPRFRAYLGILGVIMGSGWPIFHPTGLSAADFSVASPGYYYVFNGISGQNPTLTLVRGKTYTFTINTSSI